MNTEDNSDNKATEEENLKTDGDLPEYEMTEIIDRISDAEDIQRMIDE